MSHRKVLMLSPYWPPSNRIGLWRVLRLARYLPQLGWTPVICTPRQEDLFHFAISQGEFPSIPDVEVIRSTTFIPSVKLSKSFTYWKHFTWPQNVQQGFQLGEKLANRLIKDALLPDQFVEWGLYMSQRLKHRTDIDVVWATGGPFGNLVAGALVARALDVPLILDYRDSWTTHRTKRWSPLAAPQSLLRAIESWVLSRAQAVSYVNDDMYFSNRACFGQSKQSIWRVIPNSFDSIDLGTHTPIVTDEVNLLHAGNFYDERTFLPCISALRALDQQLSLSVQLFGSLDVRSQKKLKNNPLPAHRFQQMARCSALEIGAHMKGADALLLVMGIPHAKALSGKLFDYIAAGRPIIGVGPIVSLARDLIENYKLGVWVDHHDHQALLKVFTQLSEGKLPYQPSQHLHTLHAQSTARQHATLFEQVMSQ